MIYIADLEVGLRQDSHFVFLLPSMYGEPAVCWPMFLTESSDMFLLTRELFVGYYI